MKELHTHKIETKQDLISILNILLKPLDQYYSDSKARITLSQTDVHYGAEIAGMEALLRQLWGVIPLLRGGQEEASLKNIIQGIVNGTDTDHPDYWGDIEDYDQRIVELASIGYALILTPKKFWSKFSEDEKKNVSNYLRQVNKVKAVDNNWLFFPTLINVGLKNIDEKYSQELIDTNLNRIEDFYLGDGWYKDGEIGPTDYYTSFAIHFYSLIYAYTMEIDDPERSTKYKERAKLFIQRFRHWFSSQGPAIPYGRSLTYRFSQVAFFTAYIFAEVDIKDIGWIKGLIFRHLRYWFNLPILNNDETLSIGYAYPNLLMKELYNAPGSPYWALKSFLPLALPKDHVFWQVKEEPLPKFDSIYTDKISMQTICKKDAHVVMFPSGYYHTNDLNHIPAKYEKFAYSTHFGFSVPKSNHSLEQGAYDSMLAVSQKGSLYQVKTKVIDKKYTSDYNYMKWEVFPEITIESWVIPGLPWHLRIHKIETKNPIIYADHGFSIKKGNIVDKINVGKKGVLIKDSHLSPVVGAKTFDSSGEVDIVIPTSNTNVLYPNTAIPVIKGSLEAGTHILINSFYGDLTGGLDINKLNSINLESNEITIGNKKISLDEFK